MKPLLLALLVLPAPAAWAAEPGVYLPDAVRIEDRGQGRSVARLKNGGTAWIEPTRDGYSVRYSDGRPAQRWQQTRAGYSVHTAGSSTNPAVRRVEGTTVTRADGTRDRLTPTRDGVSVRAESGQTTRWTKTRDGATARKTPP